ncbi:MAG: hypothetical protein AUK35_10160 [Zetaproteobacteria bacterium CG2_30_46_52]|nr:MAG: hypothetical protein AUK35_10160 [Zetaproteobacteria bacterium CG2_30_46_52]
MSRNLRHILIVEDNQDVRGILKSMLELWVDDLEMTVEIHETSNGSKAIEWITKSGMPDILLLDVRMPVMNGAQLLRHLAQQGDVSLNKRTLLLTGYADDLEEHLGTDALLIPHLRKPFTAPELFNKMNHILEHIS